jgi:hypothetical protein
VPRDVDEQALRPERVQHTRIDQVGRARAAGRADDQEVGPARKRVQLRLEPWSSKPLWRQGVVADIDLYRREEGGNPAADVIRRFVIHHASVE